MTIAALGRRTHRSWMYWWYAATFGRQPAAPSSSFLRFAGRTRVGPTRRSCAMPQPAGDDLAGGYRRRHRRPGTGARVTHELHRINSKYRPGFQRAVVDGCDLHAPAEIGRPARDFDPFAGKGLHFVVIVHQQVMLGLALLVG